MLNKLKLLVDTLYNISDSLAIGAMYRELQNQLF